MFEIMWPAAALMVLAVLTTCWGFSLYDLYRRRVSFTKKYGCKPIRRASQKDPFFGLDHFIRLAKAAKQRRYLQYFQNWFTQAGNTFGVNLMGDNMIFTNEPRNIQAILVTKFSDFEIGQRRRDNSHKLLGVGVFNADGAVWEHGRALVRPNFTRKQVADLTLFERHVQTWMSNLPTDGSPVEFQEWAFRFTLDTGTDVLFDESSNVLQKDATDLALRFAWAFNVGVDGILQRIRLGKFASLYYDPEYNRACKVVHDYIDVIVQKAIDRAQLWHIQEKSQQKDISQAEERYTFLNTLAREGVPAKEIRDQILNILVAARDTSACLLSGAMFELARMPDVQQKLRHEVRQLNGRLPTFEDIKDMQYLGRFIKETLRLHPPIPLNARVATNDTTLPLGGGPDGLSPIFVEKGKLVVYQVYSMHRRPDIWGEDAEEFKPERWETMRATFEYLPFNAGPRICPGQQFALVETSYCIIRFLQEYSHIAAQDDGSPWTENLTLTCSVGQGVWIGLTRAKSDE